MKMFATAQRILMGAMGLPWYLYAVGGAGVLAIVYGLRNVDPSASGAGGDGSDPPHPTSPENVRDLAWRVHRPTG